MWTKPYPIESSRKSTELVRTSSDSLKATLVFYYSSNVQTYYLLDKFCNPKFCNLTNYKAHYQDSPSSQFRMSDEHFARELDQAYQLLDFRSDQIANHQRDGIESDSTSYQITYQTTNNQTTTNRPLSDDAMDSRTASASNHLFNHKRKNVVFNLRTFIRWLSLFCFCFIISNHKVNGQSPANNDQPFGKYKSIFIFFFHLIFFLNYTNIFLPTKQKRPVLRTGRTVCVLPYVCISILNLKFVQTFCCCFFTLYTQYLQYVSIVKVLVYTRTFSFFAYLFNTMPLNLYNVFLNFFYFIFLYFFYLFKKS